MTGATVSNLLDKLFYSREESAKLFGVSVGTIDNLIERGELPFKRIGGSRRGRVLISRNTILQFSENLNRK